MLSYTLCFSLLGALVAGVPHSWENQGSEASHTIQRRAYYTRPLWVYFVGPVVFLLITLPLSIWLYRYKMRNRCCHQSSYVEISAPRAAPIVPIISTTNRQAVPLKNVAWDPSISANSPYAMADRRGGMQQLKVPSVTTSPRQSQATNESGIQPPVHSYYAPRVREEFGRQPGGEPGKDIRTSIGRSEPPHRAQGTSPVNQPSLHHPGQ